jgi:hypothetical protein
MTVLVWIGAVTSAVVLHRMPAEAALHRVVATAVAATVPAR